MLLLLKAKVAKVAVAVESCNVKLVLTDHILVRCSRLSRASGLQRPPESQLFHTTHELTNSSELNYNEVD
jgi:hypothetical protein